MSIPIAPPELPTTLGALRQSGYESKSVREELRANLEQRLIEGRPLTSAVLGYEDSVLPQLETALLAGHDIILLGERGQAKTRMIRSLVELLDEWLPIIEGSEVRDDPYAPISAYAISLLGEKGDDTPIAWVHRTRRFAEKLASPDTSMADLIGEVDPIKVAGGLFLDDPRALSYGLVPKSNRGIFAMNELPDLSERIQVGLLNVLEERDCLLYTSPPVGVRATIAGFRPRSRRWASSCEAASCCPSRKASSHWSNRRGVVMEGARPVRAARGTALSTLGWPQEAALRMLENNLDPEVAERPDDLVVYGGTGRAARDWRSFDALVRTLKTLKGDETMLVQSGRPVGVFQTHEWAPRVLIANSNLVGDWATWPEFRRLEALGLTMYGQMTAGSWIYIGTQGILQGTYETFAAVAAKRFNGTLAGTLTLTGGAGGMGGAQPLAVTMNDGVCLCVDVDPTRLERRVQHRYLDEWTDDLGEAIARVVAAKKERRALSVGLLGNAATIFVELLRRGLEVDIVTDQTSAHDPLSYLPEGIELGDWHDYADKKPEEFTDRARESMAKQVEAMVGFMDQGSEVFDYGNSIRGEALLGGYPRAFDFPGFVPAYIRPLFCEGKGPFRWVALSGDPKDIARCV